MYIYTYDIYNVTCVCVCERERERERERECVCIKSPAAGRSERYKLLAALSNSFSPACMGVGACVRELHLYVLNVFSSLECVLL